MTVGGFEVEILKDWYNALLNRREIDLRITHWGRGTPSRSEVLNIVAEIYNVDRERIIVKKIESEFGWCKTRAHIHIYDSKDLIEKIEPEHMIRKHRKESKKEQG